MKTMVKNGRLANGYERGKGGLVHAVDDDNSYAGKALCGTAPSVSWSDRPNLKVTCSKCLKKLQRVLSHGEDERAIGTDQ